MEDRFARLLKLFDEKAPKKHPVFQATKIAEETGEAISLAFKLTGLGREKYNIAATREKLGDELADIVTTTFTCAKVCGIDLWRAVERKLNTEIRRWERFETTKS